VIYNFAGKNSFLWLGPVPRLNIADPELIKDVLNKYYEFRKPDANPLVKLLSKGLVNLEGEQWTKHRKIINPAFHVEKLKASFPLLDNIDFMYTCLARRFEICYRTLLF
jgi:cytochrome P450